MQGNLEGFSFVVGTLYGASIYFDVAIGLWIVQAWGTLFRTVLISEGLPPTGVKGLPLVSENF